MIVASVSCIFGLGSPEEYGKIALALKKGETVRRQRVLRHLIDSHYTRNDQSLMRGSFRVRGDTLEIQPAYEEMALRIEFWGDEIERILEFDPLTGEVLIERTEVNIYPAKHFITSDEKLAAAIIDIEQELQERVLELQAEGKIVEAQRLQQRTRYDLEMLQETGYCSGVENYSRHLQPPPARRAALDPARLLPRRLPADGGRVAHQPAPGARHVRRRPLAQGHADRLRLPPALRSRQPPPHLPGVRAPHQPGGLSSAPRPAPTNTSTASRSWS